MARPTYQLLWVNNASTTLSAPVATADTTISVTDGTSWIKAGLGTDYCYFATIDDGTAVEIVKVIGASSTTLTLERSQDGTTAPLTDWPTSTTIETRFCKAYAEYLDSYFEGQEGQVVIGPLADADFSADEAVSVGRNASVQSAADFGVAVGPSASVGANCDGGVAVGNAALAGDGGSAHDKAIAIGQNAKALDDNSIMIGAGAGTGTTGVNNGANTVVIGNFSKNDLGALRAVVLGYQNYVTASAHDSIVIGNTAFASENNSVVVGANTDSASAHTIRIGSNDGVDALSDDCIALGRSVDIQASPDSIVIGAQSEAHNAAKSIIIGHDSEAWKEDTIVLGTYGQAFAKHSNAFGFEARAFVEGATAFQSPTVVTRDPGFDVFYDEARPHHLMAVPTVVSSPPCNVGTPANWAAAAYDDGDVISRAADTKQFFLAMHDSTVAEMANYNTAAINSITESGTEPTFDVTTQGLRTAANVSSSHHWVYIDPLAGIDIDINYLWDVDTKVRFYPKRVGFVCQKWTTGTNPTFDVGYEGDTDAYLSGGVLNGAGGAHYFKWFDVSEAVAGQHLIFTLTSAGSGSMTGRFVAEGYYVQEPG